ncbi:MAG: hypothetical protein A3H27_02015 [Acidobacteria bacterium RIFCSPLOWO2_02_FULL_59_13]|nr:MAG: hypothetical protein A3H27_02015 [Acidobacteria bacterium RIFCSPLOWO2_02_FULL_59_13]
MNKALKDGFPPFLNEQSLRSAIESVCAKYGKVTHLRILSVKVGQIRKCSCFLRLDSEAAEGELRSIHDVIRFAGDLHFFADVDERWTGPDM